MSQLRQSQVTCPKSHSSQWWGGFKPRQLGPRAVLLTPTPGTFIILHLPCEDRIWGGEMLNCWPKWIWSAWPHHLVPANLVYLTSSPGHLPPCCAFRPGWQRWCPCSTTGPGGRWVTKQDQMCVLSAADWEGGRMGRKKQQWRAGSTTKWGQRPSHLFWLTPLNASCLAETSGNF